MDISRIAVSIRRSQKGQSLSENAIWLEAKALDAYYREYVAYVARLNDRRASLLRFKIASEGDTEIKALEAQVAACWAAVMDFEKQYSIPHQF